MLGVAALASGCLEPNPYLLNGGSTQTGEGGDASTAGESGSTGVGTTAGAGETAPGMETTGTDTGGPQTCAGLGMRCVEPAPAEWMGPFARWEGPHGEPSFACSEPFDALLTEAFSDVIAPAAECMCMCGSLTGASCGGGQMTPYMMSGCGGIGLMAANPTDGCNSAPGGGWSADGSFRFTAPTVQGGTCAVDSDQRTLPASFARRHVACAAEPNTLDCTGGRQCVPTADDPYYADLCIWQEGDVPCPQGTQYSERMVVHRQIEDGRDCQACSCEPPDGTCTGSSLVLNADYDCMGASAGSVPPGGCVDGSGDGFVRGLIYDSGELPSDACTPSTPVPIGQAVAVQPVTFCCEG